jgi:hypothetical protein
VRVYDAPAGITEFVKNWELAIYTLWQRRRCPGTEKTGRMFVIPNNNDLNDLFSKLERENKYLYYAKFSLLLLLLLNIQFVNPFDNKGLFIITSRLNCQIFFVFFTFQCQV